jgi:hypothetical protein
VQVIVAQDDYTSLIEWRSQDDVRIQISVIIPQTVKQTTGARRLRFKVALCELLEPYGWTEGSYNRYVRNPAA